jgi:hypothetical protein
MSEEHVELYFLLKIEFECQLAPFIPVVLNRDAEIYVKHHPINRHPEWFQDKIAELTGDLLFKERCKDLALLGSNVTLQEIKLALGRAINCVLDDIQCLEDTNTDNPSR